VAQLNAFVQEHITGMQVVQAFAAEGREFEKFKKINKSHRNANINAIFAYSVFFPVVEIVLALSQGYWFGGFAGKAGASAVSKGTWREDDDVLYVLNLLFRPLRVIAISSMFCKWSDRQERVFKVFGQR
jgi:ATP-binding cassette subfamily B protein